MQTQDGVPSHFPSGTHGSRTMAVQSDPMWAMGKMEKQLGRDGAPGLSPMARALLPPEFLLLL